MDNKYDNVAPILNDYAKALQHAKTQRAAFDKQYKELKKEMSAILDYNEPVDTENFTILKVERTRNIKPKEARTDVYDDLKVTYKGESL